MSVAMIKLNSRLIFTGILIILSLIRCSNCRSDTGLQHEVLNAAGDFIRKLYNIEPYLSANTSLSDECRNELGKLAIGTILKEKVVLNLLKEYIDSLPKPGSGVFTGNIYWYGSFVECKNIPSSHYCLTNLEVGKALSAKSPLKSVTIGLCTPNSCSNKDLGSMLLQLSRAVNKTDIVSFEERNNFKNAYGNSVICYGKKTYSTGAIACFAVGGLFVLLCLLGTVVDIIHKFGVSKTVTVNKANGFMPVKSSLNENEEPLFGRHIQSASGYESDENRPFLPQVEAVNRRGNICLEFVLCFSLIKNTKIIVDTNAPKGAITSINGIRTISMFWVILGHTYYFGLLAPTDNLGTILPVLQRFTFEPIGNAYFSVDTFFVLSGLLVAYLSMRRFDTYNKIPLLPYYLHRFLRLTPSYMFVILFYMYIYPLIGKGPSWYSQSATYSKAIANCKSYWWTNLLYINNLHPWSLRDECLGWSWYLSNDMQFYVISPIILYMMHRYKTVGVVVANGIVLVVTFVATGYLIGVNKLNSLLTEDMLSISSADALKFANEVYVKPYCRISPYIVGLVLGYYLHKERLYIIKRRKWLVAVIGWIVAAGLALVVVFGPYSSFRAGGTPFSLPENVLYGTFSRFVWGLSVAIVIYLCYNEMGGLVNQFLSWRAFIPLSRLTYGAYLVHPIVISLYYQSLEVPMHYSDFVVVYLFLAFTTMAYFCAYLLAVFVEFPVANLEKLFFKQ